MEVEGSSRDKNYTFQMKVFSFRKIAVKVSRVEMKPRQRFQQTGRRLQKRVPYKCRVPAKQLQVTSRFQVRFQVKVSSQHSKFKAVGVPHGLILKPQHSTRFYKQKNILYNSFILGPR